MKVEIRFYSQFDTDLVALAQAGYNITEMTKQAVISLAHGTPVRYVIPSTSPFNPKNKKTIHTCFSIPDSDYATLALLKNVTPGFRTSFCKTVLRNSLVQQNVSAFYLNPSASANVIHMDLELRNPMQVPGCTPCPKSCQTKKKVPASQTAALPSGTVPQTYPQTPSPAVPPAMPAPVPMPAYQTQQGAGCQVPYTGYTGYVASYQNIQQPQANQPLPNWYQTQQSPASIMPDENKCDDDDLMSLFDNL